MLQDYNFTLKHISGKTNTKADILSRLPEYPDKLEQKESTILQEKHFKRLSRDDNLKEGTNRITIIEDDPIFIKTVEESAIPGTIKRKLKEDDDFKREGKLIYWKNRLYIPNKNLQIKTIKQHHDEPTAGHPGRLRTEEIITRNYWWPTIKKDIKEYIEGCESCQRNKIIQNKDKLPLYPHENPLHPWHTISINLLEPLPKSKEYDTIAVITDKFSKMIRLIPTTSEISAIGMAKLY